jgi:spermidine synthase
VQSYELDEHIYHESLVHPGMLMHPNPRRVLVIGGGEGATLREVIRHRTVQYALMVDIDAQLIAAARAHLPTFHQGAFDDSRVRVQFGDGRAFIETTTDRFDVIVIDVTNPMIGGPSLRLFTVEFYRAVRDRLNPGGRALIQSDAVSVTGLTGAATIYRTVLAVWPHVFCSAVFLPAYTTDWSFTMASDEPVDPLNLPINEVDERIHQRLGASLRFYDGIAHQRLFHLPRYVRDALATAQDISRDSSPIQQSFPSFQSKGTT